MRSGLLALLLALSSLASGQSEGPATRPRPDAQPRERKVDLAVERPAGVFASQVAPRQIVLGWQSAPRVKAYQLFISPPIGMQPANVPISLPGDQSRYSIRVPENVPTGSPLRAWIEAVAPTGTRSQKVPFPVVFYVKQPLPGGGGGPESAPGGGPASTPSTSSAAQRCPPGQYMVGIETSGKILCEALVRP